MRLNKLIVCLILPLQGCTTVANWLDPDRANYVKPEQVTTAVAEERKAQTQVVQTLKEQQQAVDRIWSKTVAQIQAGQSANKQNPEGLPKEVVSKELDIQYRTQPVKATQEDLQEAMARSEAKLQGKVELAEKLYNESEQEVKHLLQVVATQVEKVQAQEKTQSEAVKATDTKVSQLNNDWANRMTLKDDELRREKEKNQTEVEGLRKRLQIKIQEAAAERYLDRAGWAQLLGLQLGVACYFAQGYRPLMLSSGFCFLVALIHTMMQQFVANPHFILISFGFGVLQVQAQIGIYVYTHFKHKKDVKENQSKDLQATTMKEVYTGIEKQLGTAPEEVQGWVKNTFSKYMSTAGKAMIQEWRAQDAKQSVTTAQNKTE